jgi:hypothetical protein
MKLIAIKPMRYDTRRLLAGDEFEASNSHGRLLVGIRKAIASPYRVPGRVAPIPPDLAARITQRNERDELECMRDQAKAAGIEIDNRWGVKRLQTEIEKVQSEKDVPQTAATALPLDLAPSAPTVGAGESKADDEVVEG